MENQPWNAFAYCDDAHLAWANRVPQIVQLLQDSLADVICLQEVVLERRAVGKGPEEWTLPAWTDELKGYIGVLQGLKQKEWEKMAERNQRVVGVKRPTGLATFYRSDGFEECAASKHGSSSGIAVFLRAKDAPKGAPAPEFAVGNIHLLGDPEKAGEHTKMLTGLNKNFGRREHKIIAGDFNGECEPGSSVALWAYDEGFWDAPTGTTWAEPGKVLRLDHVLYTSGLTVRAATGSLSPEEVESGLPCATCPSDHTPAAVFFSTAARGRCPW